MAVASAIETGRMLAVEMNEEEVGEDVEAGLYDAPDGEDVEETPEWG